MNTYNFALVTTLGIASTTVEGAITQTDIKNSSNNEINYYEQLIKEQLTQPRESESGSSILVLPSTNKPADLASNVVCSNTGCAGGADG